MLGEKTSSEYYHAHKGGFMLGEKTSSEYYHAHKGGGGVMLGGKKNTSSEYYHAHKGGGGGGGSCWAGKKIVVNITMHTRVGGGASEYYHAHKEG